MSKNAMAGAVTLCGVGLCLIGGAMVMQNGTQAHAAAGAMPAAAAAVTAAASAQAGGEPTVVWYGTESSVESATYSRTLLFRAWSDGTVEVRAISWSQPGASNPCQTAFSVDCPVWAVVASPTAGYRAAADINADELVNGVDLASVLSNWGDAPRVPFPPSDCPLNLINP